MKILLASLLLTSTSCCLAQQIDLTGQVSIHNSRYETGTIEYVKGAAIQAPFAGETSSDSEGIWRLTFQGIANGTIIKLGAEKAGYEVVNTYDLERVVLGQKPRLPIYITTRGRLAQAQTELYNISKTALYARKNAIIARLRGEQAERDAVLAELSADWGTEVNSIGEALELLDSKMAELEKRLPEFAQELAAKNLDFASDLYIEAYELYQAGDIEGAIAVLDDAKLEQSYAEALSNLEAGKELVAAGEDVLEKAELQIDQIIESYKLKAEGHNVLFEYRKAAEAQRRIVEILEASTEEETLELADAYGALGSTLQDLGSYSEALNAQLRNTQINDQLLPENDKDLATSYNNLALIYQDLGYYEAALAAQQKDIAIIEQVLEPNHPSIATSNNNLAGIYKALGDYEAALAAQQKALAIRAQVLDPNHPEIATSYNNLATIYNALGDYEAALAAQQKALAIRERVLEPNHPRIAASYNNLALIYQDLGDYEAALAAQQKALAIIEQVLESNHPSIATSYNNLALIYQDLGDYEAALAAQQKDIAIIEQVLEPNHPSIATSDHNLVSIYYHQELLDSALICEQRAYDICLKKLTDNHPNLQIIRNNFAFLYPKRALQRRSAGRFQLAIEDYEKALEFSTEKGELLNQLGLTYYYAGDYLNAIENYEESYRQKEISEAAFFDKTGLAYAKLGNLAAAKERFTQLQDLLPESGLPYRDWGLYYTLQGEPELALANLEKAIQLGYDNWEWLRTETALDPLRDHPRFQALLAQVPTKKD